MSKLTNSQTKALIKLRDHGPRGAYPGILMGTLNALSLRGLVKAKYGPGSAFAPHTCIEWSITAKGRAALQEADHDKHA